MSTRPFLSAVLLLASLPACSGFGLVADAGWSQIQLDGDVALAPSVGGVSLPTIRADVDTVLGLGDEVGTPYGRVEAALGIATITASIMTFDDEGSGTLNVAFGDISASTTIRSSLQFTNLKVATHFDLINLGIVRISPGVGVDLFDIDMTIRDPLTTASETVNAIAPIPMAFVQGEVDLGAISATADVGGIKVNLPDADGTYVDAEALVRYGPTPHFELFAGYRYILLDAEGTANGQSFLADLTLSGWMLGGGLRF